MHFKIPVRGQKHKMVEMAKENAQNVLRMDREKIKREEKRTIGAVHEIEELLGMEGLNRMEAFDISNISGFQTVASMVVFERGKARRRDYRKFRLRTIKVRMTMQVCRKSLQEDFFMERKNWRN